MYERLLAVAHVDDAAVLGDAEAYGGPLLPGVIQRQGVVVDDLERRVDLFDLDRDRHRLARGGEIVVDVDGVFARHDAADAHRLLPDRARELAAVDGDGVVEAAAVVAVEHHEAGLAHVVPDDVADRILGVEIDVVGVAVGPRHGDQELGLGVDLARLRLRVHREQRDEEQEGDDLQRLEQHHAEGIKLLARVIAEAVHHSLRRVPLRRADAAQLGSLPPLLAHGRDCGRRTFQHGDHEHLGQVGGEREQLRCRAIEHVVLGLQQDRADEPAERRIHGDRHAIAHQPHRAFHRRPIRRVEPGDGRQHQDEADDGAEEAELHQRIACIRAELIRPAQRIGQSPQQQRLVEPVMPLQPRLEDEIADVLGDLTSRQRGAVGGHHLVVGDAQAGGVAAQQRKEAARPVGLARDRSRAHETMRARGDVEHGDDRGDMGLVARQHQLEQAVVPGQHEAEHRHAREHQPAQQRQMVVREFAFEEAHQASHAMLGCRCGRMILSDT